MRSARTLLSTFLVSAKKWTRARLCNSRLSHTLATDTLALWDHLLDILLTLQLTAALDLNLWYQNYLAFRKFFYLLERFLFGLLFNLFEN